MHSIPVLKILQELGIVLEGDAEQVFEILEKKDLVNENYVADKLGIRINDVRKALYKLGSYGFVTYTKEKDEEKKWWYVYNWQLDRAKIHYKYVQHLRLILRDKENQLMDEQRYAFQCRKCKRKYEYEDALTQGFLCRDCSGVVKEVTNSRVISQLAKDIKELLDVVSIEEAAINKYQAGQKKVREDLHEEEQIAEAEVKTKKLADARAKRAAAKKEAERLNPKLIKKKVVKKKPAKKKIVSKKKSAAKKKAPAKKKVTTKKTVKKPVVKKATKKSR